MPEKPEVITVARKLEKKLIGKKILNVDVYHDNMIDYPSIPLFKERIKNETIHDITTRGKWIVMSLDNYYLLFHLRMEGKFFFRTKNDEKGKHEHVIFSLDDDSELRFADVRKFGKVMLIEKDKIYSMKPYTELGLEPWDKELTSDYLKEKYMKKTLPIKSVLLDQSIITGIGNIYADEILFLSHINPLTRAKDLTDKNREDIIKNTIKVLDKAIEEGGTTIRSYTSEEGVTGRFQNNLNVHQREKEPCHFCKSIIVKIKVGGRGTYYCPKCQK
ncbi:MAG: DNA-formamidopyrimidine glycosylase [Bacilli bacterium]|nr:DNA-formamidopyrimidine glycosylase [Bacilli bacterium]